jgi:ribosomal protein L11 methyltransferase
MATRLNRQTELHQLTLTLPAKAEEAACTMLEDMFGQWPSGYSEPESTLITLSLFLQSDQRPTRSQVAGLEARLRTLAAFGIETGRLRVRVTRLANRNWKESWKRHFKPLEIGSRLLLRPSWSKRRAKPGQAVVVLDPGLSFGTGQHPTTSFCLREVVKARHKGVKQSFLDIGTGSGILAISAAKLGYEPIHGFDHDPESVRVASTNALRNKVDRRIRFRQADLTEQPSRSRRKYDLVCANLLADLLTTESAKILNRVKAGGTLVVAGILSEEFNAVERRFLALGAQPLRTRIKGEWQSGSYRVCA